MTMKLAITFLLGIAVGVVGGILLTKLDLLPRSQRTPEETVEAYYRLMLHAELEAASELIVEKRRQKILNLAALIDIPTERLSSSDKRRVDAYEKFLKEYLYHVPIRAKCTDQSERSATCILIGNYGVRIRESQEVRLARSDDTWLIDY